MVGIGKVRVVGGCDVRRGVALFLLVDFEEGPSLRLTEGDEVVLVLVMLVFELFLLVPLRMT